jgi:hypothetical protein
MHNMSCRNRFSLFYTDFILLGIIRLTYKTYGLLYTFPMHVILMHVRGGRKPTLLLTINFLGDMKDISIDRSPKWNKNLAQNTLPTQLSM